MARGELTSPRDDEPSERDEYSAALAAFGLLADRAFGAAAGGDVFFLWPEHVPAFELWQSVQTQWRTAGMAGIPTGLDYAGVAALMTINRLRPRVQRERMHQLMVMERAALAVWDERRGK